MKIFDNAGYFLQETKTMIQLNLASHILSLLSTGLIFFIFAMVVSGWWVSSRVVEAIQGEAELNVYFDESIDHTDAIQLVEKIKGIHGVRKALLVDQGEAYSRMEEILGKEARILEFFDENPFSAFIEVKIHLEQIDPVLDKLNLLADIKYIRDNRDVLDRLRHIAEVLTFLGYLVLAAVGVSTLVIISHIIRLGIYNNREQINTLRLLGAPEIFITIPFLVEGLLLALGGGILAVVLASFTLKYVYAQMTGPLPFIPLPPYEELVPGMIIIVGFFSAILGIVGSMLGLSSARN